MATSEWPETSGAQNASRASRPVDRSTSVSARTAASLSDHAVRSAMPRPLRSSRLATTWGVTAASSRAWVHVRSVEAWSTMVMRQLNGRCVRRYSWRRSTFATSTRSSSWTGTTTSTTGGAGTWSGGRLAAADSSEARGEGAVPVDRWSAVTFPFPWASHAGSLSTGSCRSTGTPERRCRIRRRRARLNRLRGRCPDRRRHRRSRRSWGCCPRPGDRCGCRCSWRRWRSPGAGRRGRRARPAGRPRARR